MMVIDVNRRTCSWSSTTAARLTMIETMRMVLWMVVAILFSSVPAFCWMSRTVPDSSLWGRTTPSSWQTPQNGARRRRLLPNNSESGCFNCFSFHRGRSNVFHAGSVVSLQQRIRPNWQFTTTSLYAASKPTASAAATALSSSSSLESSKASIIIKGLLPSPVFAQGELLHETVSALRHQIPLLLTVPLTWNDEATVYTPDTRLVVVASENNNNDKDTDDTYTSDDDDDENVSLELAADLPELTSLSQALVLAATASTRVGSFLFSSPQQQTTDESLLVVDAKVALVLCDEDTPTTNSTRLFFNLPRTIKVMWEANLAPSPPSNGPPSFLFPPQPQARIQGISTLTLDPRTWKVSTHSLNSILWNGVLVDSKSLGQSLAVLRQTVQGLQNAPWMQTVLATAPALPAVSIFNQVRDEFLLQQQQVNSVRNNPLFAPRRVSPLYVDATHISTNAPSTVPGNATMELPFDQWIPIETFTNDSRQQCSEFPLPGSDAWPDYAVCHKAAWVFVNSIVPVLADSTSSEDIMSLLDPTTAALTTLDGSLLLPNARSIANFYASLAAVRKQTAGVWTLEEVAVTDWSSSSSPFALEGQISTTTVSKSYTIRVSLEYQTSLNFPGRTPTVLQGTDVYTISTTTFPGDRDPKVAIDKIHQKKLSLGDNSNVNDSVLFLRSLATAIDSSGRLPFADGFWMDLLKRVTNDSNSKTVASLSTQLPSPLPQSRKDQPAFVIRSDIAALTAYRIMETLHQDWSNLDSLATGTSNRDAVKPPASAFFSNEVQLIGFLGETILRGRSQYNRVFSLTYSSWQRAIQQGSNADNEDPLIRIELSPKGDIICSIVLFLKVVPPFLSAIHGIDVSFSPLSAGLVESIPLLKIGLVSEYALCPKTGLILHHRLTESRINGQLTPIDIVSRWIQRLPGV